MIVVRGRALEDSLSRVPQLDVLILRVRLEPVALAVDALNK
jgi:hypothetical protein